MNSPRATEISRPNFKSIQSTLNLLQEQRPWLDGLFLDPRGDNCGTINSSKLWKRTGNESEIVEL